MHLYCLLQKDDAHSSISSDETDLSCNYDELDVYDVPTLNTPGEKIAWDEMMDIDDEDDRTALSFPAAKDNQGIRKRGQTVSCDN
jgi:hypothetical protein